MHLDHQPVRPGRNRGFGQRFDQPRNPCSVARIHDHRQMGLMFEQGHGGNIEGVAGLGFEGADSAFAVLSKYMKNREFSRENLSRGFKYLMGKGFDYDDARAALERLGAETEEE